MHKQDSKLILVTCFTALIVLLLSSSLLAISLRFPVSAASQPSETPPWITAGAYLNYSVTGSFSFSEKLSNGSSMSMSGTISGSVKILVNGVSDTQASITYSPNIVYKETEAFFNGTTSTNSGASTPVNGSSTQTIQLSQSSFGGMFNSLQNLANSTYGFSPNFNVTVSQNPGALYPLNSTTNLVALAVNSTSTEKFSFPQQGLLGSGPSSSVSLNGSFGSYTSISDQVPLEVSLSFQGSTTLSGSSLFMSGVQDQSLSATVSGNAGFELHLASTNVNLPAGSANQATVSVPNLSTTLYVLSNSTLNGVATSGNELVVNVTGPSGTRGVVDVFVSNSMLTQSGITNATQVGVSVDGQSYSNYTVAQIGGGYLFTIYYHHSTHSVAMSFGNANLGNNQGTISSIGSSSSETILGIPTTEFYIAVAAVVVVIVAALAVMTMRRKKPTAQMETKPGALMPPPATGSDGGAQSTTPAQPGS